MIFWLNRNIATMFFVCALVLTFLIVPSIVTLLLTCRVVVFANLFQSISFLERNSRCIFFFISTVIVKSNTVTYQPSNSLYLSPSITGEVYYIQTALPAVCGSQIALHPFCYTYILLHIRQLLSHFTLIITLCILFMYFIKCILCLNPCFMCFCTFQSC